VEIVAPHSGMLKTSNGESLKIDSSFLTTGSVVYDAVFIPSGERSITTLKGESDAMLFLNESYMHCKAIGAEGTGGLLEQTYFYNMFPKEDLAVKGVITSEDREDLSKGFLEAVALHRFWNREKSDEIPASLQRSRKNKTPEIIFFGGYYLILFTKKSVEESFFLLLFRRFSCSSLFLI